MPPRPSQALRASTVCAFCLEAPSTPTGEHVLPRGLTKKLFPESKGPYTTSSAAGEISRKQFDSIKLACCQLCNNTLEARFESRGQSAIERLLTEDVPNLTEAETRRAALWLLKTWLLWLHPRTEFTDSFPRPTPTPQPPPQHLYTWLVNGSSPPEGLSVWAFRHDQSNGRPHPEESVPRLELPLVDTGTTQVPFVHLDLTLASVNAVLIFHPNWPIAYLPALEGRVVQLWPLPEGLAIRSLPKLSHRPLKLGPMPRLSFLPGHGLGESSLPALTPDVPIVDLVRDRLASFAM
jgi:hypothetical protein